MPTWVKVSLLILVALVLLLIVGNITGIGGDHGPRRHGIGIGITTVVARV